MVAGGGAAARGQQLTKAFALVACLAILVVGWYSRSHLLGAVVNQRAEAKKIMAVVGQRGRASSARGGLKAIGNGEKHALLPGAVVTDLNVIFSACLWPRGSSLLAVSGTLTARGFGTCLGSRPRCRRRGRRADVGAPAASEVHVCAVPVPRAESQTRRPGVLRAAGVAVPP